MRVQEVQEVKMVSLRLGHRFSSVAVKVGGLGFRSLTRWISKIQFQAVPVGIKGQKRMGIMGVMGIMG